MKWLSLQQMPCSVVTWSTVTHSSDFAKVLFLRAYSPVYKNTLTCIVTNDKKFVHITLIFSKTPLVTC